LYAYSVISSEFAAKHLSVARITYTVLVETLNPAQSIWYKWGFLNAR